MKTIKGLATKNKIFENAKFVFAKNGYANTSLKDIIEGLGIQTGNMTYYYPTKDALSLELFSEYKNEITTRLVEKNRNVSKEVIFAASIIGFYMNIFSNDVTDRFFKEFLSKRKSFQKLCENEAESFENYYTMINPRINEIEMRYLFTASIGGIYELLSLRYSSNLKDPIKNEKFFKAILACYMIPIHTSIPDLNELYNNAMDVLNKTDISDIQLL